MLFLTHMVTALDNAPHCQSVSIKAKPHSTDLEIEYCVI